MTNSILWVSIMKYKLLTPDGLEIGMVTDEPKYRWELSEDAPYREAIEDFLAGTDRYEMVVAGATEQSEMEDDDVTPPEEHVPASDYARLIRTVNALPKHVPIQVREAEDFNKSVIAKKMANSIAKGRRYVDDPSEAPEGVEVQEGPQGGYFYETDATPGDDREDSGETQGPPEFEPAETVEQAEAFAQEHILKSDEETETKVDYGEMPIESVNVVNRTLSTFTSQDHLPGLEELVQEPGGEPTWAMSARGGNISIHSKSTPEKYNEMVQDSIEWYNSEKTDSIKDDIEYLQTNIEEMERRAEDEDDPDRRERMLENAERYEEQLEERKEQLRERRKESADRPTAQRSMEDSVIHEYGHVLDHHFFYGNMFNENIRNDVFRASGSMSFKPHTKKKARQVSEYATTNASEYVAESFVAYVNGEHERLEDKVIEFWDTMVNERGPEEQWDDVSRWEQ